MSSYQFVWWGVSRWCYWWPPIYFGRYTHNLAGIYRWSLSIGPLEIRRFAK